jgi:hypothetical protein
MRRHGFQVRDIRLVDGLYHARVRNPYGRRLLVLVDPYSGHIINVKPLRRSAFGNGHFRRRDFDKRRRFWQ